MQKICSGWREARHNQPHGEPSQANPGGHGSPQARSLDRSVGKGEIRPQTSRIRHVKRRFEVLRRQRLAQARP
jgi:hypothetical protein